MQLFANNADSELDGAITSVATSITLKTGGGAKFPTPTGGDFFLVTMFQKVGASELNHEIVKCTARSGDVLTVVRAQEGTTGFAFSNADPVELRETAGTLASKQDVLVSATNIKTVGGVSLLGSGDVVVGGLTVVVVSGTTQTAVAGPHYILTNVAATTVTLPASPASGDTVWVTWTNTLTTNVIARNGQTIMGVAEDMTLDASTNGTVQLRFVNSSWRIL